MTALSQHPNDLRQDGRIPVTGGFEKKALRGLICVIAPELRGS
jgi:hypothetical protein